MSCLQGCTGTGQWAQRRHCSGRTKGLHEQMELADRGWTQQGSVSMLCVRSWAGSKRQQTQRRWSVDPVPWCPTLTVLTAVVATGRVSWEVFGSIWRAYCLWKECWVLLDRCQTRDLFVILKQIKIAERRIGEKADRGTNAILCHMSEITASWLKVIVRVYLFSLWRWN